MRISTATILSLAASSLIVDSTDAATSKKVQNRLTIKRDDILPSPLLDKEKSYKEDVPVMEKLIVEEEEFLRYLNESLLFASYSMDLTDKPTSKPFPRLSAKPSTKTSAKASPLPHSLSKSTFLSQSPSSCSDLIVEWHTNFTTPWYNFNGPRYNCAWYEQDFVFSRCDEYGNYYENYGLVANEACCACGGGKTASPTLSPSPSASPTIVMSSAPSAHPTSSCSDLTVNDGEPWYDSDGPSYDCASYYNEFSSCEIHGNSWKNFGLVANEACCACGGGSHPTSNPTTSPTPEPTYWPTLSPWNRNNYDSDDNPISRTRNILAVIGALIVLFVIISFLCVKNYPNNNIAGYTPQQTQHAARIVVDERDVRREFILINIIHKKVVTKSSQYNDSAIAGASQDNTQSVEIDEGDVIFHAIIRERSKRIASLRLSLNNEVGDEEQAGAIIDKKDDICIETLRSIRSSMNLYLDLESLDESLYSPRSCPICCEDYVKGDDVAWSKNKECCHAFHTDCIVPWLMDHDDCPMCRCVYVKEGAAGG